eukprot:c626_g1_i2.p1 GENE.c626_g1_i2~~c626_g1_i2.p1  ORF type:complete len:476 (+),score=127.43 c626_g1_i2:1-1428(+)
MGVLLRVGQNTTPLSQMKLAIFFCLVVSSALATDPFLADWMGNLLPAIGNLTVLDLSLAGTHDTMTYDLSKTVSDGGLDGQDAIVWILQTFPDIMPEEWIRKQSQTQGLTIEQQLDNGIRYIDFRTMFTSGDWYCLHCMQTNQKAMTYLTTIHDWMKTHTNEIVVMTLTKHGGVCDTGDVQYSNITAEIKQAYWGQIVELFSDMIFDASESTINTTTISDLISRNHRAIFYASDFVNFTGSASKYAIDSCTINNVLSSDVTDVVQTNQNHIDFFSSLSTTMPTSKATSTFVLLSMGTSSPTKQLEYAFEIEYIPLEKDKHRKECNSLFKFTNVTDWCPPTLLDMCNTMNFYNQFAFAAAYNHSYRLPNAIYLDGVDEDGTVRIGTSPMNPLYNKQSPLVPRVNKAQDDTHTTTRAPYVDILLSHNLRQGCGSDLSQWSASCNSISQVLLQRLAKNPMTLWDDYANARVAHEIVAE